MEWCVVFFLVVLSKGFYTCCVYSVFTMVKGKHYKRNRKLVNFTVNKNEYEKFRTQCRTEGVVMSRIIDDFITKHNKKEQKKKVRVESD